MDLTQYMQGLQGTAQTGGYTGGFMGGSVSAPVPLPQVQSSLQGILAPLQAQKAPQAKPLTQAMSQPGWTSTSGFQGGLQDMLTRKQGRTAQQGVRWF